MYKIKKITHQWSVEIFYFQYIEKEGPYKVLDTVTTNVNNS